MPEIKTRLHLDRWWWSGLRGGAWLQLLSAKELRILSGRTSKETAIITSIDLLGNVNVGIVRPIWETLSPAQRRLIVVSHREAVGREMERLRTPAIAIASLVRAIRVPFLIVAMGGSIAAGLVNQLYLLVSLLGVPGLLRARRLTGLAAPLIRWYLRRLMRRWGGLAA